MLLCDKNLENTEFLESMGYTLPRFNRTLVQERTCAKPVWLHLGAGNIFRAFAAVICQKLLDEGFMDRGIIVAEGYDYEILDAAFSPYDNLSVSVVLKADGNIEKTIIASVIESVKMNNDGLERLKEVFSSESLQLLTLTITEKGYSLAGSDGTFNHDVVSDFTNGPSTTKSYLGKLAALCYHRYKSCATPLALISMDNCSHNGARLFEAVHSFAVEWVKNGLVENGFLSYVENPQCLSFPWTMVDKITPGPDDNVAELLSRDGLEGMTGVKTEKNTFIAPFVNAEETGYFVIEDAFPNGRPPLEDAGVLITDRQTVDKVEKMKVCTSLNPLHTGLAVFGCLLSYKRISNAIDDELLHELVCRISDEGLRVVVDPIIISPSEFVDKVIKERLPNPFIPDTPQRIATDTSIKIPIRFGITIKSYLESDNLDIGTLHAIPLVLAGWLRYMQGIDDNGNKFDLSPDPFFTQGCTESLLFSTTHEMIPILSNAEIFGVDLVEAGISERVAEYYFMMIKGPG